MLGFSISVSHMPWLYTSHFHDNNTLIGVCTTLSVFSAVASVHVY